MTEGEMLKISVEEFSRLQGYMLLVDKESDAYKTMKVRYVELKVILSSSGINLTEIDRIKEWRIFIIFGFKGYELSQIIAFSFAINISL